MEATEDIKVTDGILLMKTQSGTHKMEKVIVQTKPGKSKNHIKWFQTRKVQSAASRIPVLVRNRKPRPSRIPVLTKNWKPRPIDQSIEPLDPPLDLEPQADGDKGQVANPVESSSNRKPRLIDQNIEPPLDLEPQADGDKGEVAKPAKTSSNWKPRLIDQNIEPPLDLEPQADGDKGEVAKPVESSSLQALFTIQENFCTLTGTSPPDFFLTPSEATSVECEEIYHNETLVMMQHQSNLESSNETGNFSEPEEGSDDYDEYTVQRYIDSGLRPLKSDESRLYLDPQFYRSKRALHAAFEEDDVHPLLEEIPSSIFPKKPKKKKPPKEVIEPPSETLSQGDYTPPSEPEIPSIPSRIIDPGPLKKLQEFEDVTFTIETEGIQPLPEDFCLHTKDPSDETFSTTSTEVRSIFKFFKNFCVHAVEPPGSGGYSPGSSASVTIEEFSERRDVPPVGAHPPSRSSTLSARSGQILLESNRERRKWKYLKIHPGSSPSSSSVALDEEARRPKNRVFTKKRQPPELASKSTSSTNKD